MLTFSDVLSSTVIGADGAGMVGRLTRAFRGVEGLIGLDEDVAGLERHHHRFLDHHNVLTVGLQVHVLPDTWIPVKGFWGNLNPARETIIYRCLITGVNRVTSSQITACLYCIGP